jgi:hypothetical protein
MALGGLSHTRTRAWQGLVLLVLATAVSAPRGVAAVPVPGPASVVTVFVRTTLAGPVRVSEGALATANQALAATCQGARRGMTVIGCADVLIAPAHSTLPSLLHQQASLLLTSGQQFTLLLPPQLSQLVMVQLARLLESLSLFCTQLAGLLDETASALPVPRWLETTIGVSYGPRARSALALLRRAEAWLATIDHETGAHAALPGWGSGAPSLESQLAMP